MRSWVNSRGGGFTSEEVGLLARRWVYFSRGGFTSQVVGLLRKRLVKEIQINILRNIFLVLGQGEHLATG